MANMKPPKILLYGPPGAGKTAFVGTGGKNVQILDLDGGLRTLGTLKDQWSDNRKLALDAAIECHEENPRKALAFNKCRSYLMSVVDQCNQGKYPYKVLVLDSLTTMSEYAMRSILAANAMLGKNPQVQHWGARDIMFKEILIQIKALPSVVIVLAHQSLGSEEDQTYTPAIAGKQLPPLLHSQFDEILHCRVRKVAQGKVQHIIESQSQGDCLVRSRTNFPSPFEMDKGLEALLDLMGYPMKGEGGDAEQK